MGSVLNTLTAMLQLEERTTLDSRGPEANKLKSQQKQEDAPFHLFILARINHLVITKPDIDGAFSPCHPINF